MSEFNPYRPPEAFRKNAEKNDALSEDIATHDKEVTQGGANLSYRQSLEAFPAKESPASDSGQSSSQSDMGNNAQQANDATSGNRQGDDTATNQQSDAQGTIASSGDDTNTLADNEKLQNIRLELVRLQLREQGKVNQSFRPE